MLTSSLAYQAIDSDKLAVLLVRHLALADILLLLLIVLPTWISLIAGTDYCMVTMVTMVTVVSNHGK